MGKLLIMAAVLVPAAYAVNGVELSYHGETPEWMFSAGQCRGTWFDIQDFQPGATEFTVEWVEIWLLSYPSGTCLELWNGGMSGPAELVVSAELTDGMVWLPDPVVMEGQFWCLVTSGEPIQILADGEADGHSFYSDDWLIWEQFDLGEFFISVGNESEELSQHSWAALKTAF